MREIKFRAYDEQNKQMHYDFEWVSSGKEGNDWIVFRSDLQKLSSKPHPFSNPYFKQQYKIMQHTGLNDSKGADIYEGDLVNDGKNVMEVFWQDQRQGIHGVQENGGIAQFSTRYPKEMWDKELFVPVKCSLHHPQIEVVGNIHENPELIRSNRWSR